MTLPRITFRERSGGLFYFIVVLSLLLGGLDARARTTINAASVSRVDVGKAVSSARDGDVVIVPAGSAIWTSTLTITRNISLIGAGEGRTVITANLPASGAEQNHDSARNVSRGSQRPQLRRHAPPLISVSLSHESVAPNYSFRLSGMTLRSANITENAAEHPFIKLVGQSDPAASPSPYVHGCVSRVRLDHMAWDKLNGLALLVDSCLGVADHITADNGIRQSPPIKVFMNNWTPALNPATGVALPKSYLATKGFGSWADDPYWGTDKFWFFEDCNFTVLNTTNVADDEVGARAVFRHCTFNGGGGVATHGMEGRAQPGIKQHEIYNNYFITDRTFAQHRSGTVLYFNNKSTAMTQGIPLKTYRKYESAQQWGAASGDNRYDENAGGPPLVTGQITAVAPPGGADAGSITVGNSDDLSSIDVTDGSLYVIVDLDDPYRLPATGGAGTANDPGWQFHQSSITSITGNTLTITHYAHKHPSANWKVGHHYSIRKVRRLFGQPGQGKGDLIQHGAGRRNSYNTYPYPATSGPKARHPMTGYPLEPCYSWNNYDDTNGHLGFSNRPGQNSNLRPNRDYFNKGERTPLQTQKVGYPAQDYTRATANYPEIGATGTIPYKPYTYPHPLTKEIAAPSNSR